MGLAFCVLVCVFSCGFSFILESCAYVNYQAFGNLYFLRVTTAFGFFVITPIAAHFSFRCLLFVFSLHFNLHSYFLSFSRLHIEEEQGNSLITPSRGGKGFEAR